MSDNLEKTLETLKEYIAWHQQSCIEMAHDMTQTNYNQVVAARKAILDLFTEVYNSNGTETNNS